VAGVSTVLIWVLIAFAETACSGAIVLINKRLLRCLDPVATNMLVRTVSVTTILIVTAPLTLLGVWSLTYDMTWEATGYIVILAVVGWLVAQSAYYYALRSGRVSVVVPITSTNLLFTALFATVLIGGVLGKLTLAGLLVAAIGVIAIARADRGDAVVAEGLDDQPVLLPRDAAKPAEATGWSKSVPVAVVLALTSAAGWGLGPVLIQLAQKSLGGTTVTMIVMAQGLGALLIAGFVLIRRVPLATRTLTRVEKRRALRFVVITGMLEGACAVIFYLIIQNLGSVLTAMIAATSPIFAILWSALFLHERLSRRLAFAVALTLLGVFLATADRLR